MKKETYLSAIEKIESDPLNFLFSSHAEKRERQLSRFKEAVEQSVQRTAVHAEGCACFECVYGKRPEPTIVIRRR